MDKPFIVSEDRHSNCCGRLTCIITFVVLLLAALVGIVNMGLNSALVARKIFDDMHGTESITRNFEFVPHGGVNHGTLVSWCNGTKLCGGMGYAQNGGVWLDDEIDPSSAGTVALNEERVVYVATDKHKENIFAGLYTIDGVANVAISSQIIDNGEFVIGVGKISDSDFLVFSTGQNGIKANYMSIDMKSNQFISQDNLTVAQPFILQDKKQSYATCPNSNYCAVLYKGANECYQSVIKVDAKSKTLKLLSHEKSYYFTWRNQIKGTNGDNNSFIVSSSRNIAFYEIDKDGKLEYKTTNIPYTGLDKALVQSVTYTYDNIVVVVLANAIGDTRVVTATKGTRSATISPLFDHNVLKLDTMKTCYMNHSQDKQSMLNATGIFTFFRSNQDNRSYMMRMNVIPQRNGHTTVSSLPIPISYQVDGEYFLECDTKYNTLFAAYSSSFPGATVFIASGGDRIAGIYVGGSSSKGNVRIQGIVSGYKDLKPGYEYFSNIWGELTINSFDAAFTRPIGRAISETELLVYENLNDMSKFI